jgi:hypothetical protein
MMGRARETKLSAALACFHGFYYYLCYTALTKGIKLIAPIAVVCTGFFFFSFTHKIQKSDLLIYFNYISTYPASHALHSSQDVHVVRHPVNGAQILSQLVLRDA